MTGAAPRRTFHAVVLIAGLAALSACHHGSDGTDMSVEVDAGTDDAAVAAVGDGLGPVPDLSGADLSGADLLGGIDFVEIVPANGMVAVGATTQLTVMGHYLDGSVLDVTEIATWASSQVTIAKVSDTTGTKGRASGVSPGTANVYALVNGKGAMAIDLPPSPWTV